MTGGGADQTRSRSTPRIGAAHTWDAAQYIDRKMYSEAEAELSSLGKLRGYSGDAIALLARGMADPAQRAAAVDSLETSPANADIRRNPIWYAFISYHWDNATVPWMNWKSMRSSLTALSQPGCGIAVSIRYVTIRASKRFLRN